MNNVHLISKIIISYTLKGPINHDNDGVDDSHVGVELALVTGGLPVELVVDVAPVGDGLLDLHDVLLLPDLTV